MFIIIITFYTTNNLEHMKVRVLNYFLFILTCTYNIR